MDIPQRDPTFIQSVHRMFRPVLRIFRCEVFGMQKLGEGPYLLIANHNIGAVLEILALQYAWEIRFSGRKPIYGLAHSFGLKVPGLSTVLRKLGGIPATMEAAYEKLGAGHSVAIFPGGNYEAVRPFYQRNICDFAGHRGWARIASSLGVPVVPISIMGSHSVNPVLLRSRALSWILVLPRLLGIRWYALTLSQIVYSAVTVWLASHFLSVPIAIFVGYFIFVVSVIIPIYPAKIRIRINDPIELAESEKLYAEVTQAIQNGMDELNS